MVNLQELELKLRVEKEIENANPGKFFDLFCLVFFDWLKPLAGPLYFFNF